MSENTQKIGGVVPDIHMESGTVLEISGSTETSVSGSIYTGKYAGTTGSIGSTTVDRQKIWLELSDGSERWYRWTGRDVPLRHGHKVSAVMVSGGRYVYTVAIVNHTTKEYFLTYADLDPVLKDIGAGPENLALGMGLVTGLVTMLIAFLVVDDRGLMRNVGLLLGGSHSLYCWVRYCSFCVYRWTVGPAKATQGIVEPPLRGRVAEGVSRFRFPRR